MEDMVRSLIYSASHFPRISWVHFRVEEGKEDEVGQYIDITRPMPVRRPGLSPGRQVLFNPVLSGNRYYLNVQETYILSTDRRDLAEKLIDRLMGDNRAFFPRDMQVNSVAIGIDAARIDLGADVEALKRLLKDRDRAELLVDSVTLTLVENFSLNHVEILINGKPGDLLFPGFFRGIVKRPYFVNPE